MNLPHGRAAHRPVDWAATEPVAQMHMRAVTRRRTVNLIGMLNVCRRLP
jgi:hypothetical protein